MQTKPNRSALAVIFLTVMIDLLGFGIVLPLLPVYAADFLPETTSTAQRGLIIGLLMSSFSAMQFCSRRCGMDLRSCRASAGDPDRARRFSGVLHVVWHCHGDEKHRVDLCRPYRRRDCRRDDFDGTGLYCRRDCRLKAEPREWRWSVPHWRRLYVRTARWLSRCSDR